MHCSINEEYKYFNGNQEEIVGIKRKKRKEKFISLQRNCAQFSTKNKNLKEMHKK